MSPRRSASYVQQIALGLPSPAQDREKFCDLLKRRDMDRSAQSHGARGIRKMSDDHENRKIRLECTPGSELNLVATIEGDRRQRSPRRESVREQRALGLDEKQQQELRSRNPNLQARDNKIAASTSAREQLFQGRKSEAEQQQTDPSISKTETLMSHNRTEQETLTNGLLDLAAALKQSSLQFSSSIEAEKDVLKRAEGGLDKSAQGMDAAAAKMSTLRRMSEGQGWWGRLKLYGMIFGLWLACFLLVFVGPKLRF